MRIKIKIKDLIYLQIVFNCFAKFLITDLGFPNFINYFSDVITIALVICTIKNKREHKKSLGKNIPIIIAGLIFLVGTISYLINFSSPLLYLWGLRNMFRFFVFFYCCVLYLKKVDGYRIFSLLEKIFIINFFVCLYEYFVRNMTYDYLGGIFGNGIEGGNGPLDALLIIVCIYVILEFTNKRKKLPEVMSIITMALLIAAIAEMKFFFFQLIIAIVVIIVLLKHNVKMFVVCVGAILIGTIALNVYSVLYPSQSEFLNLDFIIDYSAERTYGGSTDINRLTALPIIQEQIFKNELEKGLVGLGIGNGETSAYSFLNSTTYKMYGNYIKYTWFSHSFTFVEYGYIGLILYFLFFLIIAIDSYRFQTNDMMGQACLICTLLFVLFIVYNQILRTESMGYTMFAIMSIPYIKEERGLHE
ncbi:hypothetical protein [uncultured Robinsoniella sp.]|uniref:hypothetical protein n=1 Tax=uncultured Robinsoniella sp. TaxID=904190 RepID=UPI00374F3A7E